MAYEISDPTEILDWLVSRVTQAEVESAVDPEGNAFDPMWSEWVEFKSMIRSSHELWHFRSPDHTWTGFPLCGVEGYVLVGSGQVQNYIVLRFS